MAQLPTRVVHASTAHGSADNRIRHKECVALASEGYNVTYLCRSHPQSTTPDVSAQTPEFNQQVVHTVPLPSRRSRISRALLGSIDVWKQLKRIQPHILHVHDPELIPLAALWRGATRRIAIYDAHEDLSLQVVGKDYIPRPLLGAARLLGRSLELLAAFTLDAIVVANPHHQGHFPPAKTQLVQNFPWRTSFEVSYTAPRACEARQDFVYVGAVSVNRGSLAMSNGATRSGASLLVAGPIGDAASREVLARPNITTLGAVNASKIPDILRRSRAGLAILRPLPNYLEAQSTKIYEYMAAGIPFIASSFPNWKEQLEGYKAGIFVDPLNDKEISEAMLWILDNPKLAQEMGDRGREASHRFFSFEEQAQGLTALYSHLTLRDVSQDSVGLHD